MKKFDYVLLLIIVLVGLLFRIYNITSPLGDFHSWRQADTAAVSRNFARDGIDLLKPRFDDLSSIQSGIENPEGIRMVEFPIYNAATAILSKINTNVPIEVYGRIISIVFALTSIAIIYYIVRLEIDRNAAIFASVTFAIFPFFVFFTRTVLPETTAIGLAMIGIFFAYIGTRNSNQSSATAQYLLSATFFSLSLLVKPTTIFYLLVPLYLFSRTYMLKLPKQWWAYVYAFIVFAPLLWWRNYILQFPEGIPPSEWLFTHVNTYEGMKNIFFRPAFFRWIFYERISQILFGGYLIAFFILGMFVKQKKYTLLAILTSGLLYLFTFQGGNIQHEYYQTIVFPALAIYVGIGAGFVVSSHKKLIHPALGYMLVIGVFTASWFFSWYRVEGYYHVPDDLVQIANVIQTLTKPDDLIVTDRLGDTTLLYLADRKGSPAIYRSFEELKAGGYGYVITRESELIAQQKASRTYDIIFENDQFTIFKL